jgi:hypothetical protein
VLLADPTQERPRGAARVRRNRHNRPMVYKADTHGRAGRTAAATWPGRAAVLLGALATVLAAAAYSVPGVDYLLAGLSWPIALAACGAVAVRERPRWHRAAGIAAVAACFGAASFTDLTMRYRFEASEAALTAFAQDTIVNVREQPIGPIRIGSYQFERVRYLPDRGRVEFVLGAGAGFLYDPARRPASGPGSYRPLGTGWYAVAP